jgi:hypothetical protein
VDKYACRGRRCAPRACEAGWADCNDKPEDGCEIDLGTTLDHCGACGQRCEPGAKVAEAVCVAGACSIGRCDEGRADCNARVDDGCEVDLGRDPSHCGRCNAGCGGKPHVSLSHCQDGACAIDTCEAGFRNADADSSNGCEEEIPPPPPIPPPPSELPELPPPLPETLPPTDEGG